MKKKYWRGTISATDDFGVKIDKVFYDARSKMGPWGRMAPASFKQHGCGLGEGNGQKYELQSDGKWLKTEG